MDTANRNITYIYSQCNFQSSELFSKRIFNVIFIVLNYFHKRLKFSSNARCFYKHIKFHLQPKTKSFNYFYKIKLRLTFKITFIRLTCIKLLYYIESL